MAKSMKGVLFPGSKTSVVEEFEIPQPGVGEVLLEMRASGMCGSDLEYIYKTPREKRAEKVHGVQLDPRTITGHEPSGVVVSTGVGIRQLKAGDRVAVYHINGCGFCKNCRQGWGISCTEPHTTYGFDRHGGNADYMVADERDCIVLPRAVSFEAGAFAACGAGTGFGVSKRLEVSGLDDYLIMGAGPVGLSAALFGKEMGARIIVVDINDQRLDMAKSIGANLILNPSRDDVEAEVKSFTAGEGVSAAVDATANSQARVSMLKCCGIWARAAFVGEGNETTFDVSPLITHKQLKLIGSWVYSMTTMMELVDLIGRRGIPLDRLLVTDRYSIEEAPEAFEKFEAGKTAGKGMFLWN
jgi:threonine dehydrogenase-like Zn-dependent dehydrogenase